MLIVENFTNIEKIHLDDEDFNIQLSSIISKFYRSPRQYYSKNYKRIQKEFDSE